MKPFLLIALFALLSAQGARPSWTTPIDSRTTSQWLAESPGTVYAPKHGRVVAIATKHGSLLWQSFVMPSGAPAYLHGTLAVPTKNGVAFLSASNGRVVAMRAYRGSIAVAHGQTRFVAVRSGASV
jgi:outer membrane protein assembly factor BamB